MELFEELSSLLQSFCDVWDKMSLVRGLVRVLEGLLAKVVYIVEFVCIYEVWPLGEVPSSHLRRLVRGLSLRCTTPSDLLFTSLGTKLD